MEDAYRAEKHHVSFTIINTLEIHSEPVASIRNNRSQNNASYWMIKDYVQLIILDD